MGQSNARPLRRLIYRSVSLVDPDAQGGLNKIICTSEANNSRVGITGCLTLAEGTFVQVLEGASETLDEVMERIRRDDRHRTVTVLGNRPITARLFRTWGMARITVPPFCPDLMRIVTETGSPAHVTGILLGLLEGTEERAVFRHG